MNNPNIFAGVVVTNLTENEMAATAAGLWEPNQPCRGYNWNCSEKACHLCGFVMPARKRGERMTEACGKHDKAAPDMHDPANLWRALENRGAELDEIEPIIFTPEWLFAALVALYKAEHPQDFDPYE